MYANPCLTLFCSTSLILSHMAQNGFKTCLNITFARHSCIRVVFFLKWRNFVILQYYTINHRMSTSIQGFYPGYDVLCIWFFVQCCVVKAIWEGLGFLYKIKSVCSASVASSIFIWMTHLSELFHTSFHDTKKLCFTFLTAFRLIQEQRLQQTVFIGFIIKGPVTLAATFVSSL